MSEEKSGVEQGFDDAKSMVNTGEAAYDTAKKMKEAADAVKAAASAGETAKTAATVAKATAQAGTGNWVGAAVSVVKNTKVGKAVIAGILALMLIIPIIFAMLPSLTFVYINEAISTITAIHQESRDEAAAEHTSSAGIFLDTIANDISAYSSEIWDGIRSTISSLGSRLRGETTNATEDANDLIGDDDYAAVYDEDAAIASINQKVKGTQLRVERRTDELKDALESVSTSGEPYDLCVAQSPSYDWSSEGASNISVSVNAPDTFSEGNALKLIAAFSTQAQQEATEISTAEYLAWIGTEPLNFFGVDPPWKGTYMSQQLYTAMEQDMLADDSSSSTLFSNASKKAALEEISENYEQYQTALVNYLVIVEEPTVDTWTEERVKVETKWRPIYTIRRDENGRPIMYSDDQYIYDVTWESYEVRTSYYVGAGSVTYTIRYLSADELSSLMGFWENGTGTDCDSNNGERADSYTSVNSISSVSSDASGIYSYLRSVMGLNPAAACGVLANMEAESGFNPTAVGDNGTSYGLCQWHNNRMNALKSYCAEEGLDYTSVVGQLSYLQYELQNSYPSVWRYLNNVPNTAQGAYDAAYYWCMNFEVPADRITKSESRGNTARSTYWNQYGLSDNVEALAGVSGGEFLIDDSKLCVEADSSYTGHAVSVTAQEQASIIKTIYSEFGGDATGAILVAQVIRDSYDYYADTKTIEQVIKVRFSPSYWVSSTSNLTGDTVRYNNAVNAFNYVFVEGNSAVRHKLLSEAAYYVNFSQYNSSWKVIYKYKIPGYDEIYFGDLDTGSYVNPNSNFTLRGSTSYSTNVKFRSSFFTDYDYYFSDRFGFDPDDDDGLLNTMIYGYWFGRYKDGASDRYNQCNLCATDSHVDTDISHKEGDLLYQWVAQSPVESITEPSVYSRQVAYEDDYYLDTLQYAADYAGITLETSSSTLNGANGATIAQLAEQEYANYGDTVCGSRYWPSPQNWCADFVYYCADQLGYVGSGQLFGPKTSYVPTAINQIVSAGASYFGAADGVTPQVGDIATWWNSSRAGRSSDYGNGTAIHIAIVVEVSGDSVTVVEGNTGGSNYNSSYLRRRTYSLTGESWSGAYFYLFLRPNYPSSSLDENDHGSIQSALLSTLYQTSGGSVTCGMGRGSDDSPKPGYVSTDGKHEGIDCALGRGSSIYSIISGEVIRVTAGSTSNLSTIAIYDATNDMTVIYLHSIPSVSAGQYVNKGDLVGTESDHGIAGSPHTHVEIRQGRNTGAAKSVLDYTQDNSISDTYSYLAKILG